MSKPLHSQPDFRFREVFPWLRALERLRMRQLMRSSIWVALTFVGVLVSLVLVAKGCEVLGLLDLTGFTFDGILWGGILLALVGVVATAFLARDIAIWALQSISVEQWLAEQEGAVQGSLPFILDKVLEKAGWHWKKPLFYIYPGSEINTIGLSVGRRRSIVLLSSGLVERGDQEQIEAALTFTVKRLISGDLTALLVMFGMIVPMTLFPARMMALLLGTSLRSSEEETPSDAVETFMVILLEAFFVLFGALAMRQFSRSSAGRIDSEMMLSPLNNAYVKLLESEILTRRDRHRERFTAPFCAFDRVPTPFTLFRYVRSSQSRLHKFMR